MRKSILLLGLLFMTGVSLADELLPRDSVGVERINGQSFIIHQVDEKETLFAISRRYKTPVNEIVQNNDELKNGLKIGQRIRIPFVEKSAIPAGAKLHNVAPGETMFSIAKAYNVSINDLMSWNDLKGSDLSVGQALIIQGAAEAKAEVPVADTPKVAEAPQPTVKKAEPSPAKQPAEQKSVPAPQPTTTMTTGGWITHQVTQGQTLFSIAKQYNAKVEDLIAWNGLTSNNLSLGQNLKVGRDSTNTVPTITSPAPANKPAERQVTNPTASTGTAGSSASSSSTAFKNVKETGQAEVIEGTGNHKKYLVLHRTAPVGTIMRIRNEQNDITVFARVVGVLPDTGDNSKLIIKVSKAAYDQLKAVNSRFPVEISY
ncbi:MAG TPA: LysM peptidoglycan-binding domain-containing protein [Cyclobacteriaceae bacterium]|nr:LysM peptidoglycan-binding domain-containing protein [Cyclobacteriaceae bacterium]